MRELQLYPPRKLRWPDIVRKLQFVAGGAELVAWVDQDRRVFSPGWDMHLTSLYALDPASGEAQQLVPSDGADFYGDIAQAVVSPDGRTIAADLPFDDTFPSIIQFRDRHNPGVELPTVETSPIAPGGLFFTSDGAAIVAARNGHGYHNERDIVRFEIAQLHAPPKRFVTQLNPFTGAPMQVPVRNLRWKQVIPRAPWKEYARGAALSACGRSLAVEDSANTVHIADLKAKKFTAKLPVTGKSDRALRLGFDPAAQWLVRLANGRLSAHPLGDVKPWKAKPALGEITDFAFHPTGRVLCVVCATGQARDLDPRTGAVLRTFKWSKKPLHAVTFSPDGLTCAAGGTNGRIVIWDVDV